MIGSLNVDLVVLVDRMPASGETVSGRDFARHAGGKGLNQAIAAARSGQQVHLVGAVGDDDGGTWLRGLVRSEGIDDLRLATVDGPSGTALIEVDSSGANRIVVVPGANGTLSGYQAESAIAEIHQATVVLANLEATVESAVAGLRAAQNTGLRTILNPAPVPHRGLPAELLPVSDILVPNEHEASLITGTDVRDADTALAAGRQLIDRGVGCAVVTLGDRGAVWVTGDAEGRVPAYVVDAVDTTAAGDAFCGTLAASLSADLPWDDCLRRACAAGALATTSPGAMPSLPAAVDIDRLVSGGTTKEIP